MTTDRMISLAPVDLAIIVLYFLMVLASASTSANSRKAEKIFSSPAAR